MRVVTVRARGCATLYTMGSQVPVSQAEAGILFTCVISLTIRCDVVIYLLFSMVDSCFVSSLPWKRTFCFQLVVQRFSKLEALTISLADLKQRIVVSSHF